MNQKPFDAIAKTDIEALIASGVHECKTLEYKQELPGPSDDAKKEFLADVSSFANASGGDMIYGIKAAVDASGGKTGAPGSVQPITETTADEAKLRLENMIRDGIAPRLHVQIKEIPGWGVDGLGFLILLRIPRSFASPHMVTFKGSSRFFSRNSAGKYRLDVGELRAAFLATDSQAERIKRFREDRLAQIVADETPVVLASRRLVVHLIPIASFLNSERLDLTNQHVLLNAFPPIGGRRLDVRYNVDGFLTWIPAGEPTHGFSYCQLFSHGAVEAVGAGAVLGGESKSNQGVIVCDYEGDVVDGVTLYLTGYKKIGIIPPIAIGLSLLGCKGSCLWTGSHCRGRVLPSIDRDAVILPDVVIDSLDVDVTQVMKPVFDMVWNACGYPRSLNYDEAGNWAPLQV